MPDLVDRPPLDVPLLPELVARWASERPNATAVLAAGTTLDHATLDRLSRRAAARLRALGVPPEGRVAVLATRTVATVALFLGVLRAGRVLVPLGPDHPADRTARVLADSAPHLVVADAPSSLPEGTASVPAAAFLDDRSEENEENADGPCAARDALHPDQLAYLLYTSGSTGEPKGVAVTHRALANCLTATAADSGIRPGDRLLAVTGWTFDIAFLETFLPLVAGGETVLAGDGEAGDGHRLAALLDRTRPRFLHATPALWEILLLAGWPGDLALEAWCGGDVVSPRLAARLTARTAGVRHLYGPTETTLYVLSRLLPPGPQPGVLPAGAPIAGVTARVTGRDLAEAPAGATGELCVGGVALARGYHGRPGATALRFVPAPGTVGGRLYRTGDLARRRADGEFELRGRADRQVKIRGHRVEPAEVEHVLTGHPALTAACVVPVAVRGETASLTAVVCPGVPVPTTEAARRLLAGVRERVAAALPEAMRPADYALLPELPLTVNGKVNRALLAALAATRHSAPAPSAADAAPPDLGPLLRGRLTRRRAGRPGVPAVVFVAEGREEARALDGWIAALEETRPVWLLDPTAPPDATRPPAAPFLLAGLRRGASAAFRVAAEARAAHGAWPPLVIVDPAGPSGPPPGRRPPRELVQWVRLTGGRADDAGPETAEADAADAAWRRLTGHRRPLSLGPCDVPGVPSDDVAERLAALVYALG
ncbi:amino acid adenylation domain-containing protein [Streptomyces triticirhizae]|uniref:amino acid adenylation domain-containing protein n=1 Tax=Streptomyces triticirhizae TaxID=2483353 RepID=UPI001315A500|nr:amino acid adenylation domain-containing protein [Streptomyces triticirhizae]